MNNPLDAQPLSPQRIAYCVILYEAFSNPLLSIVNRDLLFSYLLSQISNCNIHKSLSSLIKSAHSFGISSDILELLKSRIMNVKTIDDIFLLFNSNLKEIRGDGSKINESRHLELGGILDTFVRRSQLEFGKMLFEELHSTFEVFKDFCKEGIPEGHPVSLALDERKAINTLFKSPLNMEENTKYSKGNNLAQHFLKYIDESLMQHPNSAIDSLHNCFHSISSLVAKTGERPKMHYASLNLSSVHYRFGQFDEALLNIAETIKLSQSKNDKEAITYSMLWLSCILGELGLVDLQKTLLQHILMESHEQKLNYIFVLAADNFVALEHTNRPIFNNERTSSKLIARLGLSEYDEPIWEKILWMASQKLNILQSETGGYPPLDYFPPLATILKTFNYSIHGIDCLFSSIERIQYSIYNTHKEESLNSYMLLMALKKSEISMKDAFVCMREAIKGSMETNNWFSVLSLIHKFELNRNNLGKCRKIESFLFDFSFNYRKTSQLCYAWELRNDRLIRQGCLYEALISIRKLMKFSSNNGLLYRAIHDYLSIVQVFIVLFYIYIECKRIFASHDFSIKVH